MNFNAHEMTAIRDAITRLAMDEVGPNVTMARKLRERFAGLQVPKGVHIHHGTLIHSQQALDTLCAHAHHGFKHGHFSGSFGMDNGTYKFETFSGQECIEENYHQGNTYKSVPRIKFEFHPWPNSGTVGVE